MSQKTIRLILVVTLLFVGILTFGSPSTHVSAAISWKGVDVSSLQRAEELGQAYKFKNGTQADALDIFKANGFNYVRVRVWVNPVSGYNNKAKVLTYATKVKAKGLKLLVDLHYSDTWADPGNQNKPVAWASHNLTTLKTDVYNHTYDVCNSLKAQGTTPDSMQIGNEINVGMLWNEGKVISNNFVPVADLLKQGYNAVKACNASTSVIIHTADADSMANMRWFYDGITAQGVTWDVTGLSYYCFWHGTMSNMQSVVADAISRYGKPVWIVETAYAFTTANGDSTSNSYTGSPACTGYGVSETDQKNVWNGVSTAASNGGAVGLFYWEPTWVATSGNGWDPNNISGTGSGWDNQATFNGTGGVANSIIGNGFGAGTYDNALSVAAFNYLNNAGWSHGSGGASNSTTYNQTNSWNGTTNQYVTVTFTGTQIKFYGVKDPGHGIGAVSIDGGAETNIDFYAATRAGNQLMYTSPTLSSGIHTFKLRVTGTKNGSSTGYYVSVDRVDIS